MIFSYSIYFFHFLLFWEEGEGDIQFLEEIELGFFGQFIMVSRHFL